MTRWGSLRGEIERAREQQTRYDVSLLTAVIKRLCHERRCDERAVR